MQDTQRTLHSKTELIRLLKMHVICKKLYTCCTVCNLLITRIYRIHENDQSNGYSLTSENG
jgi:hypothetical protein